MTENLPAVRTEIVNAELVQPSTDSWTAVIEDVALLAQRIAGTQFVPRGLRDSVPATAAAILYGREVGLPPMTALAGVHVVDGRPTMSAELLRGMVLAAGHEIVYDELSGATVTVRGKRSGSEHWTKVTWTLDMARAAGLLGKDNWKKYPRAMLVARATAELCRMAFPDVTHGMRATEELDDAVAVETAGAAPQLEAGTTKVQRQSRRRTTQTTTHAGDGAAVSSSGNQFPGEPPAAASSPLPPLPGEPGYDAPEGGASLPTSPGPDAQGSGGTVGADGEVLEGPGDSTGASQGEPAAANVPASGPSAPTTQTPASAETAEGASPLAGEQDGEGDASALGGSDASPEPHDPHEPDDEDRPRMISRGAQRAMFAAFKSLGIDDDAARLYATSAIVGREIKTSNGLTAAEGKTLLDTLATVESREQLAALIHASESSGGEPA